MLLIAEGVAGGDVAEADGCNDGSRVDLLDLLTVVRVHEEKAADSLSLAGACVQHRGAALELAAVDAEKSELTHEGVIHDLEGQRSERSVVVGFAREGRLGIVWINADGGWQVQGRREVVDDGIKQVLDALILEGASTEHRDDLVRERADANRCANLCFAEVGVVVEEARFEGFVALCAGFDEKLAGFFRLVTELFRDVDDLEFGAGLIAGELDGLHGDEVNDAAETAFAAQRKLHGEGRGAEACLDGLKCAGEVSANLVHLVDETDARDLVAIRLAPHRFGLGLDALFAVENRDAAVEDKERALNLDGEIDVPRRVDDVDAVRIALVEARHRLPKARGGGACDGNAALLLLGHPVHRGRAIVDLADLMVDARVVEDPFRRGCLARINVRHDPDISGPV